MNRVTPDFNPVDQIDPIQRRAFVPIDTMVEARRVDYGHSFTALANALNQINPEIERFVQLKTDQAAQQDAINAKAMAVKTGLTYQEAIKRGIINENQSPYFNAAWNEIDGRNQGDTGKAAILQAYQTDPISQSGDPKAVSAWLQQQIAQQAQGITDQNALTGFSARMQELQPQLLDEFISRSRDNAITGMTNTLSTQVGNIVDQYLSNTHGQPINPELLAAQINGAAALPKFAGLDHKTADATVAEAVINKAKALGNADLLDVLNSDRQDMSNPNSSIPGVGKTVTWSGRILEAEHAIKVQALQDQNQQYELEQRQRAEQSRALGGQIMDALMSGKSPPPGAVDSWVKIDPAAASQIQNFQLARQRLDEGAPMSPMQYAQNYSSVVNVPQNGLSRVQNLTQQVTQGKFTGTTQQLQTLYERAQTFDDAGPEKVKPVADIYNSLIHSDPLNQGVPSLFKDPNAQSAVAANFLVGANQILKDNPGVDPVTLTPKLMELRKKTVDDYAALYPNAMNLNVVNGTPPRDAPKPVLPAPVSQTSNEPARTPNGGLPSQFALTQQQINIIKHDPFSTEAQAIKREHAREFNSVLQGM